MNFLNQLGKDIEKTATSIGHQAGQFVDGRATGGLLTYFSSGNIVCLVARNTGKALQIVSAPDGRLILDGMGVEGPQAFNTHWTIVNEGNNIIRLHNNNNYIVINQSMISLLNHPPPAAPMGAESRLRLSQSQNMYITMESVKEPGHYVTINQQGQLQPGSHNLPMREFIPRLLYLFNSIAIASEWITKPHHTMKCQITETVKEPLKSINLMDKTDVRQFVDKWFQKEGEELEEWSPPDLCDRPALVDMMTSVHLQAFAMGLNSSWKDLGRQIKPEVSIHPERFSLINVEFPFIIPGGRFREFYYWDSYWMIKGLLLCGMNQTVQGMLKNFLVMVQQYGFVPNGGRVYYLNRSQPPLLIPMMQLYHNMTGDTEFIRENLATLEKEYQFWRENRLVSVRIDDVQYDVYRYSVSTAVPRPESYREDKELAGNLNSVQAAKLYKDIASAAESGWDFSSRWFDLDPGNDSNDLGRLCTSDKIPVDLNAFMCWNENILSSFYGLVGDSNKHEEFAVQYNQSIATVSSVFWDDDAGAWFDYDIKSKKRDKRFFASTVTPLFTQIHGKSETEKKYIEQRFLAYIKQENLMSYVGGIPTSLIDSSQQWDYPNAWPPLQHMWVHALASSSVTQLNDMAKILAQKWVQMNLNSWLLKKSLFEKYNAVTGSSGRGGEYDVQTGFGWSNGVVLDFMSLYPDMEVSIPVDNDVF